MSSLTADQVSLQLDGLSGWELDGKSLVRVYQFGEFADVIAFITRAAFFCETLEHHPTWENYYTQLKVRIGDPTQAEVQGRDVQLAKRLESVFAKFS